MHQVFMIYPDLLFSLVGEEIYMRCDQGMGSPDLKVQQAAIKEMQNALLTTTAFTTGFQCSVAFSWMGAQPGAGRLQKIVLRPAEPKYTPTEAPGEGWEIVPRRDHSVYAIRAAAKAPATAAGPGTARSRQVITGGRLALQWLCVLSGNDPVSVPS